MQKENTVRFGLSMHQSTAPDQRAVRAIALESESLSLIGAFMCLIGLLFILADNRQ